MIESVCSLLEEATQIQPNQELPNQELLDQENACLRAIIVDLLIKNQKLRWAVQTYPQLLAGS